MASAPPLPSDWPPRLEADLAELRAAAAAIAARLDQGDRGEDFESTLRSLETASRTR